MRLLFICPGSRGDFEPLLAVAEALALVEPGGVCIAAHAFFKEETEAAGCAFAPLSGSPSGGSDGASWATQLDEAAALAHGASFSAVVANWFATPAALSLAELHGLPVLLLWPGAPLLRTAAFACPLVGGGDALRGWSLFDAALWRSQRPVLNAWRARLGMPPLGELSSLSAQAAALRAPVLLPFSPLVLPRPPDWPPRAVLTGAWRRRPPHDYTPPPGLLAFLEAPGPPVVCAGFGAAPGLDAAVSAALAEGCALSGFRLVLLGGGGAPGGLPPLSTRGVSNALYLQQRVPHAWLLPRCALLIHHGGAGTCGAAMHAGTPQLLAPLTYDQPWWAARMAALGVAPEGVLALRAEAGGGRPALCPRAVAAAVEAAAAPPLRARAAALAAALATEADGAEYAAVFVQQWLAAQQR